MQGGANFVCDALHTFIKEIFDKTCRDSSKNGIYLP